jgi:hypothetical protein
MKTKILTAIFALLLCGTMVFAQDSTKTVRKQMVKTNMEMQKDSVYYTCTMHPEVRMDSPGKCPKCGKELVKTTVKATTPKVKSEGLITYTCPMHPEITSGVPGKCPKCGMDLVAKK